MASFHCMNKMTVPSCTSSQLRAARQFAPAFTSAVGRRVLLGHGPLGRRASPPHAAAEAPVHQNGNGNGAVAVQPATPASQPAPAPAPAAPAPAAPAPVLLAPAAVYALAANVGAVKAKLPLNKAFVLAILAGAYVGFGALLSFTLLNSIPGIFAANVGLAKFMAASVFPMGLSLILICGAELFTGNTALLTCAALEGKANWVDVLVRWTVVYFGNFVGCLGMVFAVHATGLMSTNTILPALAVAKTSIPLSQALVRSVLCNWMVCLSVWMAMASSTLPGKLIGCWLPVTAFVTVGLEHSIANMFVVPMGMLLGAKVTVGKFLTANLIPVTLGNIFAGAVCTAVVYSYCYGKLGEAKA